MTLFRLSFAVCLGVHVFAQSAAAQLKLSSKLDYNAYVLYEPIRIVTKVTSESGRPIVFNLSEDDPQFYYSVKDERGYLIREIKDAEKPFPEMIPARSSETMTNNLLRNFQITEPGYYSVQPCVDWRGKTHRGRKIHFEVLKGREIKRLQAVVPADNTSRTYSLIHVNRKLQDHLLLRIDDEDANLCYGVFPLGRTTLGPARRLSSIREIRRPMSCTRRNPAPISTPLTRQWVTG